MTEILNVANEHLRRVKKSGNEDIMALCPFHRKADGTDEKNPSFSMNIYSGLWYCHSCHARGNLFTFLRDVGLPRAEIEFRYKGILEEAAKYLPPKPDPLDPQAPVNAEPLPESFLGLFDYCPQLLLDEGYPEELLRKFDIGFDQVHQRITFPLRDRDGNLVGLSGRTVLNASPRYKVYDWEYKDFGLPERKTEKRRLLWNGHNVLTALAFETDPSARFVVVNEGFKAVLRVAQADILNVTGILGSYLSSEQQWALERLECPIILMLDNNDAGIRGQIDAGCRLTKCVPHVFVAQYDANQPSDLTPALVHEAISGAVPFHTWLMNQDLLAYL